MRAILMFHNCEGQSHKTVSTDHNLWSERRAEADSNRGPSHVYQPTALPQGQTGIPVRDRASFIPSTYKSALLSWLALLSFTTCRGCAVLVKHSNMIRLLSERETGLLCPLIIRRAERARRNFNLELSKHRDVEGSLKGSVNSLDLDVSETR